MTAPPPVLRCRALLVVLACLAAAPAAAAPQSPALPGLSDVTAACGLEFVHVNGMTGEKYMVEVMGSGAALLDYDGDGRLDLFLAQGTRIAPPGDGAALLFPPPEGAPPGGRLFRNVAAEGGGWRFEDVTESAGIVTTAYGMGAAAADADGDGDADLFLANFGPDQFWRNEGDGTFADATAEAGLGDDTWSVGATWFDADDDGDLDLYVARYVAWSLDVHQRCDWFGGREDYCGPLTFQPLTDLLYLNDGAGRFVESSGACGLGGLTGAGLGVVAGDWNEDGRADLYVANDAMPNFLWVNLGPPADDPSGAPRFVEMALDLGVALGGEGFPEGSMGIAAGDPDGDGDEDLLLTHFTLQKNTFYRNLGGVFQDQTASVGLEWPSRPWTGFGVGWLELDGDGWLDLFVANGAVHSLEDRVALGDPYPLRQRNQVFLNRAGRGFDEATARAGSGLELLDVSRGAAFGDLDDDGDLDIVVANNNGPARVLRNDLLPARAADVAWLGLDLRQPLASGRTRPALLARADLRLADGRTITRWSRADGSYASSADPRILFHWPAAGPAPVALRITWPGRGGGVPAEVALPGSAEGKAPLLGRYHRVVEGVPSDLTVPAARGE